MPTFCRHSRLIQNCPICSKEQAIELRPVVSSSAPRTTQPRPARPAAPRRSGTAGSGSARGSSSTGRMRVRQLARGADDGYQSPLLQGLKSSAEAERLAEEIAFAATRLSRLQDDPPGLYAEVAHGVDSVEERAWLAFLIAYIGPASAGEGEDAFASIAAARTTWASGENPSLEGIAAGPRTAHDPARGVRTIEAYRAWAARAGSQAAAFTGDAAWTAERRFERVYERLSLPGLHRDARFELLETLGRLGVFELEAGTLRLGGADSVTVAAKRTLGIGDPLLLERRAAELADACGVPVAALDLGFHNWERGRRATLGEPGDTDPEILAGTLRALGLEQP